MEILTIRKKMKDICGDEVALYSMSVPSTSPSLSAPLGYDFLSSRAHCVMDCRGGLCISHLISTGCLHSLQADGSS